MDPTGNASVVGGDALKKYGVHETWEARYRNPENEKIYELAFDLIAKVVGRPGTRFLDAGCGSCAHSMRLANREYKVCAIDYSTPVVETAKRNVAEWGLSDRIHVQQDDNLNLSFDAESFDNVLCWGVLMHISDIERAIGEFDRVLKKGGMMVLSEANVNSLYAIFYRNLRLYFGKRRKTRWSSAGFERWEETKSGEFIVRQTNMNWLKKQLTDRGYTIRRVAPGEFAELYSLVKNPLIKKMIHQFNRFWFRKVGWAGPALGNILIAEKPQRIVTRPK